LDDEVDVREKAEYPDDTAGEPIGLDQSVHERWKKLFKGKASEMEDGGDQFHPFSSELEWELARWAISEQVSQSSFNKLLEIPGVS
ncbi:hypothetical protein K435DRAFT_562483, partial [Dendrothele bispora CBS 962.96]